MEQEHPLVVELCSSRAVHLQVKHIHLFSCPLLSCSFVFRVGMYDSTCSAHLIWHRNNLSFAFFCSTMLMSRPCPGAVLLLPLLDFHLRQLFQTVDAVRSGSRTAATRPSVQTEGPGRQEFISSAAFSVEDIGLASLRLLYLLVVHSDEVRNELQCRRQDSASGCAD